eukprot:scaffold9882_cov133-Isochrysis_galbana.AAC.2
MGGMSSDCRELLGACVYTLYYVSVFGARAHEIRACIMGHALILVFSIRRDTSTSPEDIGALHDNETRRRCTHSGERALPAARRGAPSCRPYNSAYTEQVTWHMPALTLGTAQEKRGVFY